jgi:hypothetical protein
MASLHAFLTVLQFLSETTYQDMETCTEVFTPEPVAQTQTA